MSHQEALAECDLRQQRIDKLKIETEFLSELEEMYSNYVPTEKENEVSKKYWEIYEDFYPEEFESVG